MKISWQKFETLFFWFIIYFLLFNFLPPTKIFDLAVAGGGDLGSHQTALKIMAENIFPGFFGWTNDWYLGMPIFSFYFPLPFWIGGLLTKIGIPLAIAFKIIVMLGTYTMPISAYYFGKKIQAKYPILLSFAILFPLLFPPNTIIGGSIQSTFAGEFTHMWSLNFLLIFMGLIYEKKKIILPAIIFSLMAISHMLSVIFAVSFIAIWWLLKERKLIDMIYYFKVGVVSFLMIFWWIIPFLLYRNYTTNLGYFAGRDLWTYIYENKMLWLAYILILPINWLSKTSWYLIIASLTGILLWQIMPVNTSVWLPRFLAYYFVFIFLLATQNIALQKTQSIKIVGMIATLLFFFSFILIAKPQFIKGNFSYAMNPQLPAVSQQIINDLNSLPKGRILDEYDDEVSVFSSPRGMELIPVYTHHDYVAGLYLESALTTPISYLTMAELSFHKEQVGNYFQLIPQERITQDRAYEHLKFLAINYILVGKTSNYFLSHPEQFELFKKYENGLNLFIVKNISPIIEPVVFEPVVLDKKLDKIEREKLAITWMLDYLKIPVIINQKRSDQFKKIDDLFFLTDPKKVGSTKNITTSKIEISEKSIKLSNLEPNIPYWIKISYHPAWKTKKGKIFQTLPGLMLIVPSESEIELKYQPLNF